MNILVTGGAGYIGSVLTPLLLGRGHAVTVLDNFMYRQNSLLDCCTHKCLRIVRGDVRDSQTMRSLISQADVVLPLACLTGAPLCSRDPQTAAAVNFEAVKSMVEMMSRDQLLIFPSTNSGYGVGQGDIFCDESTPLRPVSLYGRLKVDLEARLLDSGTSVTFRFATLFGISPRMRLDLLVNDFTYRAVTDHCTILFEPHFKRNYLHVRDAAQAFMHTIQNYAVMKGRPYNVGLSNANLSKWELCERIQKHVQGFYFVAGEIGEDPDKRNYVVSNERIESTGFTPAFSLDDGIAELVKGYQVVRRLEYCNT